MIRDDFTPESNVDVLVERAEGKVPVLAYFDRWRALADIIGRRVDFLMDGDHSRFFADRVAREAVPIDVSA